MTSGIAGSLLGDALKGLLLRPWARVKTHVVWHKSNLLIRGGIFEVNYRSVGKTYAIHPSSSTQYLNTPRAGFMPVGLWQN